MLNPHQQAKKGPTEPINDQASVFDIWYWKEGQFISERVFENALDRDQRPRVLIALDDFEANAYAYEDISTSYAIVQEQLIQTQATLSKCRIGYFRELEHLRDELRRSRVSSTSLQYRVESFEKYVSQTDVYFYDLQETIDQTLVDCMASAVKDLTRRLLGENYRLRERLNVYEEVASDDEDSTKQLNDSVDDSRVRIALETFFNQGLTADKLINILQDIILKNSALLITGRVSSESHPIREALVDFSEALTERLRLLPIVTHGEAFQKARADTLQESLHLLSESFSQSEVKVTERDSFIQILQEEVTELKASLLISAQETADVTELFEEERNKMNAKVVKKNKTLIDVDSQMVEIASKSMNNIAIGESHRTQRTNSNACKFALSLYLFEPLSIHGHQYK